MTDSYRSPKRKKRVGRSQNSVGFDIDPALPGICEASGKTRWPNRRSARASMLGMRKRGLFDSERLTVYRCPSCGAHHVGHSRQKGVDRT